MVVNIEYTEETLDKLIRLLYKKNILDSAETRELLHSLWDRSATIIKGYTGGKID
jgi:predicted RNA binding protein with dsRBD fold (UPF0201 family)